MDNNNCDRHIFLYAKGWYKKVDVLEDLRILVGARCAIETKHISNSDILTVVGGLYYDYISKHNFELLFRDMFNDIYHFQASDKTDIRKVLRLMLRELCMTTVKNGKGGIILRLGKPDYTLLPKKIRKE